MSKDYAVSASNMEVKEVLEFNISIMLVGQ